jgi:CBS domain-containing protein
MPEETMPEKSIRRGNRLMDRPEYRSKQTPLTRTPETSVLDAAKAMSEKNYGSVIVVDSEDKVVGLVTERDVLNRLVAHGLDAKKTPLSAIMTQDPRLASETDNMLDWLRIMSNERFRRLPVVDDQGRIKAVFTQGDFVSYTWPDLMYQMKAIGTATVSKNLPIFYITGGIAIYSLFLVGLLSVLN